MHVIRTSIDKIRIDRAPLGPVTAILLIAILHIAKLDNALPNDVLDVLTLKSSGLILRLSVDMMLGSIIGGLPTCGGDLHPQRIQRVVATVRIRIGQRIACIAIRTLALALATVFVIPADKCIALSLGGSRDHSRCLIFGVQLSLGVYVRPVISISVKLETLRNTAVPLCSRNYKVIANMTSLLPLGIEAIFPVGQCIFLAGSVIIAGAVRLGVPTREFAPFLGELVCLDINLLFGLADGRRHGAFATICVVEQTVSVLLIVDIDDVFAILLDRDGVIRVAVVIGVVLEGTHHIIGIDTRSHRAHRGIRTHDFLSVHINMIDRQICKVLCVNLTVEMPRRTLCNIVVCAGLHMKLRPRCVINNERLVRPIADDTLHGLVKSPSNTPVIQIDGLILI